MMMLNGSPFLLTDTCFPSSPIAATEHVAQNAIPVTESATSGLNVRISCVHVYKILLSSTITHYHAMPVKCCLCIILP